jgi:hypothetical protein
MTIDLSCRCMGRTQKDPCEQDGEDGRVPTPATQEDGLCDDCRHPDSPTGTCDGWGYGVRWFNEPQEEGAG